MTKRKICIITGTRAEYGLLYWLMKEIEADPGLELQIIATGMHLSPEFGLTYKTIENDGFVIHEKVEMLLSSDTPIGVTKSLGLGVVGIADSLDRLRPDIIVLLGDRFEILAAAQAAMIARIPIAHISGGETTQGVIDEAIRHAVTKMAHYHFVAAEPYRKRVIQLGEEPGRVMNFGDPGLDNITKLRLLSPKELEQAMDFDLGDEGFFLVTYHPVTLKEKGPEEVMASLLSALDCFPEKKLIITKPNADMGGRAIISMIDEYSAKQPNRVFATTSLGQLNYLSAMKLCAAVIGNSSSGIVEAPALRRPTVNIGDRQKGRLKAVSIIDCAETTQAIIGAIKKAVSDEFCEITAIVKSVYGSGDTSKKIKQYLKEIELTGVLEKAFYDIDFLI